MQCVRLLPDPQAMSKNLKCQIYNKKGHIHRNCPKNGQLDEQQYQNSFLFNLMIGMIQSNVVTARIEEFSEIEEVLALDIFIKIIYNMVPKLLAAMLTTIWILDLVQQDTFLIIKEGFQT